MNGVSWLIAYFGSQRSPVNDHHSSIASQVFRGACNATRCHEKATNGTLLSNAADEFPNDRHADLPGFPALALNDVPLAVFADGQIDTSVWL